jgi:hypothetical protein
VFNLWEIINPTKKVVVDNALIYDVLIHLIFDITTAPV